MSGPGAQSQPSNNKPADAITTSSAAAVEFKWQSPESVLPADLFQLFQGFQAAETPQLLPNVAGVYVESLQGKGACLVRIGGWLERIEHQLSTAYAALTVTGKAPRASPAVALERLHKVLFAGGKNYRQRCVRSSRLLATLAAADPECAAFIRDNRYWERTAWILTPTVPFAEDGVRKFKELIQHFHSLSTTQKDKLITQCKGSCSSKPTRALCCWRRWISETVSQLEGNGWVAVKNANMAAGRARAAEARRMQEGTLTAEPSNSSVATSIQQGTGSNQRSTQSAMQIDSHNQVQSVGTKTTINTAARSRSTKRNDVAEENTDSDDDEDDQTLVSGTSEEKLKASTSSRKRKCEDNENSSSKRAKTDVSSSTSSGSSSTSSSSSSTATEESKDVPMGKDKLNFSGFPAINRGVAEALVKRLLPHAKFIEVMVEPFGGHATISREMMKHKEFAHVRYVLGDIVPSTVEYLRKEFPQAQVDNIDAQDLISQYSNQAGALIFLDPPWRGYRQYAMCLKQPDGTLKPCTPQKYYDRCLQLFRDQPVACKWQLVCGKYAKHLLPGSVTVTSTGKKKLFGNPITTQLLDNFTMPTPADKEITDSEHMDCGLDGKETKQEVPDSPVAAMTVYVPKILTDQHVRDKLRGKLIEPSAIKQIFTTNVDVYDKETKELLFVYRKNVVTETVLAEKHLSHVTPSPSRGRSAAGGVSEAQPAPLSSIYGSWYYQMDKKDDPDRPKCRQTRLTVQHKQDYEQAMPFIQQMATLYQQLCPKQYERQASALKTQGRWVIGDTPFTTFTVNKSWQTRVHKDEGDLFGFSPITTAGKFAGGQLCYPAYGIGFELQPGDYFVGNAHEWHGNLPITSGERLSYIFYAQTAIVENCPGDDDVDQEASSMDTSGETITDAASNEIQKQTLATKRDDRFVSKYGLSFLVRPDTSDEKALTEVLERNQYERPVAMKPPFRIAGRKHWLDLGANIGAFSARAAREGAFVTAYEPEASNQQLWRSNMKLNSFQEGKHCQLIPQAISVNGGTQTLYLCNSSKNKYRHTLWKGASWGVGKRSVEAATVALREVLSQSLTSQHLRPIDAVKMDVEGEEILILEDMKDADWCNVKQLVFEYSFDADRSIARFYSIVQRLKSRFPDIQFNKSVPESSKEWSSSWYPASVTVYCRMAD